MTGQEIVPLHKRIRQEAAGLTHDQAGQRLSAAERIALKRGAPGERPGSATSGTASASSWSRPRRPRQGHAQPE